MSLIPNRSKLNQNRLTSKKLTEYIDASQTNDSRFTESQSKEIQDFMHQQRLKVIQVMRHLPFGLSFEIKPIDNAIETHISYKGLKIVITTPQESAPNSKPSNPILHPLNPDSI